MGTIKLTFVGIGNNIGNTFDAFCCPFHRKTKSGCKYKYHFSLNSIDTVFYIVAPLVLVGGLIVAGLFMLFDPFL